MAYKILYYSWNENTCKDCVDSMRSLGHNVDVITYAIKNYNIDDGFTDFLTEYLTKGYDLIFTFNYFPLISNIAQEAGIPYVFWVYDSPHYTLESHTLSNSCNRGFLFDRTLVERYRSMGIDTVSYLPLGCNIDRLEKLTSSIIKNKTYKSDVSFIGSLYQGKQDIYTQINYLPDYLKGYIDAILWAQMNIYGMDFADAIFSKDMCQTMAEYVKVGLGEGYNDNRDDLLKDMIRKHITGIERARLLDAVGQHHSLDLYSNQKPDSIRVNFKGIAENYKEMPLIFASSKINLNITLRTIQTGIPLRIIEIIGAGGFCLTNYQSELQEYFEYGKDIIWFESQEDLVDKCNYYLFHDTERENIAARSHEKARQFFDYKVLLPKVLII